MKEELKIKKLATGRVRPIGGEENRIPDARSAAALAVLDYRRHGSRKFKAHLRDHLVNGYVISTPSLFAMFKAVLTHDGRTAWYVSYARGDLRELLGFVPFPLPWIAFRSRSRNKGRIWPFERFVQLAGGIASHKVHKGPRRNGRCEPLRPPCELFSL